VQADNCIDLLAANNVAAFFADQLTLATIVSSSQSPGDYSILNKSIESRPSGLMYRKNDLNCKL